MKFLLFLGLALSTFASNEEVVNATVSASRIYELQPTGSMEPALDERYLLLVQKIPWSKLQKGDIIIFRGHGFFEGSLICHRIWSKSSGGSALVTKGDANHDFDRDLVVESEYIGMVVGSVRKDIDNVVTIILK